MLSHVEAMIKISKGLEQVATSNVQNLVLAVLGTMLPKDHMLPKNTYESMKLLRTLKMPYESIHACPNGCVLFRGEELKAATHYPKCKASRYVEVNGSDRKKEQSKIPEMVVRYLPLTPRLQRMFMTEESTKQMTWHKDDKRYSDKMVHPANADAWRYFDIQNPDKAKDARNVRVAIATDGFNPYGTHAAPYTCWPVFMIPSIFPQRHV
jgi:hypothetical protein